jgi:fumarylpyruvate hydrolase
MSVIPAPPLASLPVLGSADRFPVHRIYCIGRNYAEHAREMGATVDRGQPVFFLKAATCLWDPAEPVPYPPATQDLHHEVELVAALGAGGRDLDLDAARRAIHGYALGLDLTRRDLQAAAKAKGLPWDTAKNFEAAAPTGPIRPVSPDFDPTSGELSLEVNGVVRQRADIAEMVFQVPEIVAMLSRLFTLRPGDLVFTGTPAGVAALVPGDRFVARFPGLPALAGTMA